MRIGELLNTKVCDVDRAEHKIMIYQAPKTSVGRVVYFSDDAKELLRPGLKNVTPMPSFSFTDMVEGL